MAQFASFDYVPRSAAGLRSGCLICLGHRLKDTKILRVLRVSVVILGQFYANTFAVPVQPKNSRISQRVRS